MNLITFLLVCYGITNIMVFGSIFEGFRNLLLRLGGVGKWFHKLFTCPMCLSVWVGFVVTYLCLHFGITTPIVANNEYILIFLSGLLSGGGVWLMHTLQEYFEK